MEELREEVTKATQAVERAQSIFDASLAEFNILKSAHEADYQKSHPSCSPLDLHNYVMEKLKAEYEDLARKEDSLIILEERNLSRKEDMQKRLFLEQQAKCNFIFSVHIATSCPFFLLSFIS